MKTYTIELSEAQFTAYIEGLEFYSRFLAGQTDALPDTLYHKRYSTQDAQFLLDQVQQVLFPDLRPGSHHGLRNIPGDPVQTAAVVAYEMYREGRVVRAHQYRAQALARGESSFGSVYDGATLRRTDEPLPVVTVNEKPDGSSTTAGTSLPAPPAL